jgi:lysophospholipase L1-like esterase
LRESFFVPGDQSSAAALTGISRRGSWFVLVGVDVETSDRPEVIVALGDSITDGFGAREVGGSWPERLAQMLGGTASVINAGISANRILRAGRPSAGPSALTRFDDDVLATPGVTTLIVLEGINDIQSPGVPAIFGDDPPAPRLTSADVIAGLTELAERGRAAGLRVVGGTLLPVRILPILVADGNTVRTEVNEWIRTTDLFDAVIDFDAVMADPGFPAAIRREFDSGDTIHPNDAGYHAMAEAARAVLGEP